MIRLFSVSVQTLTLERVRNESILSITDLVFIMDCTGSMGAYIDSATKNIRLIVQEIVTSEKSDIHLALIEYRDHPPQVSVAQRE
jgi:hypothetical protein